MENNFKLKIFTSESVWFDDYISEITFQTLEGKITILGNHTPIIGYIEKGKSVFIQNGNKDHFFHANGAYSFQNNELKFIVHKIDKDEFDYIDYDFSKDKKIIIDDNEIIENYTLINSSLKDSDELIEFEFKRILKKQQQ